MNIGDIFLLLRADGSVLTSDIQLAATNAGQAGAASFVQRFGSALRVGAAVLGASFGVITQEMSNAEAQFVADTGASLTDAQAWGRDINAIAGSSKQSFADLVAAGTDVQRLFHGTADETRALTLDIRDFNTATKVDMVQAADAAAKAIDAWGLTTAALPGLLDKAVFAAQNYRISAGGMLTDIGLLAPAFQGLGLNADQAAGFIALASSAGVDAESMVRGLGGAIKKLPPGTTLEEYLTSLAAITSDSDRAVKATLFLGPLLGPKLAQMVGPGRQSLEDITAALDGTTGATNTAAAVIENTWGYKFAALMNGAKSAVRGLGDEFGGTGSLLTGIALAGPLILKLGATAGGLYGAGVIASANLVAGLQLIWGEAAAAPGMIAGIRAAGAAAGALYGTSAGAAALSMLGAGAGALAVAWGAAYGVLQTGANVAGGILLPKGLDPNANIAAWNAAHAPKEMFGPPAPSPEEIAAYQAAGVTDGAGFSSGFVSSTANLFATKGGFAGQLERLANFQQDFYRVGGRNGTALGNGIVDAATKAVEEGMPRITAAFIAGTLGSEVGVRRLADAIVSTVPSLSPRR